ncbi:MAG: NAD(P)H-binding protein [Bacillota bacterium]
MEGKSALIVGASGLVGNKLLKYLLSGQEYRMIVALVRNPLNIKHPKLEEKIIDFDNISSYKDSFRVNDIFCCVGTTINKAKSREKFKKVDVDYPIKMAKLSKETQVEKFLIISSMGANPNSLVFYSKMKGLLEDQIKDIGLNSLHIFRPSLLLGTRKEFRLGETIGKLLAKVLPFTFIGPLEKYKPIEAETVALGMYRAAQRDVNGIHIYLSNEISKFADKDLV